MPRIEKGEYRDSTRTTPARGGQERASTACLLTSFDSIYYLTGAGFEPLERPFFLIVLPRGKSEPALLVPRLDAEHMRKAGLESDHAMPTGSYPRLGEGGGRMAPGCSERIGRHSGSSRRCGGTSPRELAIFRSDALPLVERLRLVKSPGEVAMIRQAAALRRPGRRAAPGCVVPGSSRGGGFARPGPSAREIIREVEDWEILTTRVLMATWAAPRSAQPHSIPALGRPAPSGPHVALALLRVNGYAAESERTYFTVKPTPEMRRAFRAMLEARKIASG